MASFLLLILWLAVPFGPCNGRFAVQDAAKERDEICSLAAYAVVYKDWQAEKDQPGRGHNIGSILVDSKGCPVFAARNCNYKYRNTTQHGEVRLIAGPADGRLTRGLFARNHHLCLSVSAWTRLTAMPGLSRVA